MFYYDIIFFAKSHHYFTILPINSIKVIKTQRPGSTIMYEEPTQSASERVVSAL